MVKSFLQLEGTIINFNQIEVGYPSKSWMKSKNSVPIKTRNYCSALHTCNAK